MTILGWKAAFICCFLVLTNSSVVCPTGSNLIPNCASCTASGSNIVCQTCINGYYLAPPNCLSCAIAISNCLFCSTNIASQLVCSVCASNYGLLSGQCRNCSAISGCVTCSIVQNNLLCIACSTNLVLYSAQSQCVPCQITNCTSCSINNLGIFTCSNCSLGYYLSNNTCLQCATSIQYCTSCLFDQNSKLVCAACASNKLYLQGNQCVTNCTIAGTPECSVCQLTSLSGGVVTCSSCVSGYYLNGATKTCQSCNTASAGCANCTVGSNGTSCITCMEGYFLTGTPASCVLCSTVHTNCNICNINFATGASQCIKCSPSWYLNATDNICYSCSASPFLQSNFAPGSCSVCQASITNTTTQLICTTCANGYFLLGSICTLCSSPCSSCSSSTICTNCSAGYLLSATTCQPCSQTFPNCLYCNSVECTDCQSGYYTIDNKQCVSSCLVSNCLSCQAKNNQFCIQCKQGYTLSSGTCLIMQCSGQLQFNGLDCVCPINMYSNGGVCTSCSDQNCMYCPANLCKTCFQGYYQTNGVCQSCLNKCRICLGSNQCLLCNQGYYFSGTHCLRSTLTVAQQIGIYLSGNLNKLCGFGCTSCSSSTSCLSCGRGFYLNISKCLKCGSSCSACNLITTNTTLQVTVNGTTSNVSTTTYNLQCIVCDSGTALFDNSCLSCEDRNCISCDFNTQFCIQCRVRFVTNRTGSCVPCAANCDFCDSGGPGTCDSSGCSVGYTQYNATVCLPCKSGCSSCDNTFPFNCKGCLIGTFNSSLTNTCENCPLGCATCSNPNNCTACVDNYQLNNNICTPYCLLPCLTCTWKDGLQQCLTCLSSYNLTDGICRSNSACMASNICQFCVLTSFAYKGQCYSCGPNCDSCTFSPPSPDYNVSTAGTAYFQYVSCSICSRGFFYDSKTLSCNKCTANCQVCDSLQNCLNCTVGYFQEERHYNFVSDPYNIGLCQACDPLCMRCSLSPNRCTQCKTGFQLNSFKCISLQNISFSINLAVSNSTSLPELTANFNKILSDLYSAFGSQYVNNNNLVNIISFSQSSLIINGVASIDSSSNPSTTYNNINTGLKNTNTLGSYSVSSYSVQAQGFTPSTDSSSSSSIGIIVGCILAGLIVIVVVVIYLVKRQKKQQESTVREETQTQPTSKGMLKQPDLTSKESENGPSHAHKNKRKAQRREVSHISETHSKDSEDQRSKNKSIPKDHSTNQRKPESNRRHRQDPSYTSHQKSKRYYQQEPSRHPYGEVDHNIHKKPKTTKLIAESSYAPQYQHRSARDISSEYEQRQPQVESHLISNDSNITKPKAGNVPRRQAIKNQRQNSQQRKYVPNKNTHFI